jgi:hypothetical protein
VQTSCDPLTTQFVSKVIDLPAEPLILEVEIVRVVDAGDRQESVGIALGTDVGQGFRQFDHELARFEGCHRVALERFHCSISLRRYALRPGDKTTGSGNVPALRIRQMVVELRGTS